MLQRGTFYILSCKYFSTENIPGSEYTGTKGMYFLYFKRYFQTTLQAGFTNSHSYQQYVTVPISPQSWPHIITLFIFAKLIDGKKKTHCTFNLHFSYKFSCKRPFVIFCMSFVLILFLFSYCVDGLCVINW